MQVVGFNFTKIHAERFSGVKPGKSGNKVSSNIEFKEINKENMSVIGSDILRVGFHFTINYDPKFGEINFEGIILLKGNSDKMDEIESGWKKKKMPEDFKLSLLNVIMSKCTLKALQFEDELQLPPHMKLPRLQHKK